MTAPSLSLGGASLFHPHKQARQRQRCCEKSLNIAHSNNNRQKRRRVVVRNVPTTYPQSSCRFFFLVWLEREGEEEEKSERERETRRPRRCWLIETRTLASRCHLSGFCSKGSFFFTYIRGEKKKNNPQDHYIIIIIIST
jgi:hypothetical protein